uniref:proto-oncogene serine/threonine-protein kinase mos n=1 Tax=Myxine glutinosa TaxID=7769 RepID=UPI00358DDA1A
MPSPVPLSRLRRGSPSTHLEPVGSPDRYLPGSPTPLRHFFIKSGFVCGSPVAAKQVPAELQVGEKIGAGSFGVVYRGVYCGHHVAVKRMHRRQGLSEGDDISKKSFLAELNVKSLQHPNLVTLLAAWMQPHFRYGLCNDGDVEEKSHEGTGILIMELLAGPSLYTRLFSMDTPISDRSCLEVGRGLAAGLSYLHGRGIVHLDVRPANAIMVGSGVKLCDFGCSQRLEPPSHKGRGSPTGAGGGGAYTHRAPELLRGERASASNDIYSLAVTLWQMWARCQPYGPDGSAALYNVVAHGRRPDFPLQWPPFPVGPSLRRLIEACWQADEASRPLACHIEDATVKLLQELAG